MNMWPIVNASAFKICNIYLNAEIHAFTLGHKFLNAEISAFPNLHTPHISVNTKISAFTNMWPSVNAEKLVFTYVVRIWVLR